jgi:CheY-like chemotaxis protein
MPNRKTILIVDDIPLMRTILAKYVKSLAAKVFAPLLGTAVIEILEAANGKTAFEKLKDRDVDLIFLDLMMPEMDGLTFLSMKRANPNLRDIPVIVCSALGEKQTVERARELGAVSYIMKPFTLKSVEEKFREAIPVLQG